MPNSAEGVIEGTNTGLLHKVTRIEGRIQDWSDNHWVNDDYTFVYKGDTPATIGFGILIQEYTNLMELFFGSMLEEKET